MNQDHRSGDWSRLAGAGPSSSGSRGMIRNPGACMPGVGGRVHFFSTVGDWRVRTRANSGELPVVAVCRHPAGLGKFPPLNHRVIGVALASESVGKR